MNLIKLIIFWLSAGECLANIFDVTPKISGSGSLVDVTVGILSSCYDKEVNTVGLAGTSDGIFLETFRSEKFLRVALIDNDTNNAPVDQKSRQKLQVFVVTASSSMQLEHTLGQVKRSRWWNHMATFLIVDWSSSTDHGCSNAFPYLWTAWNKNLLKALYVCQNETKRRLIYSFNPYTRQAPNPWLWENTFGDKNDHPWTLFRREYDRDGRICMNLDFDKTIDLGGYKIYSSVKASPTWIIDHNKNGASSLGGRNGRFARAIFEALNATPHLIEHDSRIPGYNDRLGNDMAMDTVNGISDVLLLGRIYPVVQNYTLSQASCESELSILTQQSGHQSQLTKLLNVLDRSSRLCLCLVAVTSVIFFKCFLHQSIGSAVLNVFRLIANSSLTKVPNNQAARFYLASVFILVVTIVGIYQGKLASLLTKSKPMPNVETMQDLAERGYTIHGHKTYAYLFADPVFRDRFVKHEDYNCAQYVVRDPLAACVQQKKALVHAAARYKLHLSREPALSTFNVFVIREDWPLEERFNTVLAALAESDVTQRIGMAESLQLQSIAKFHEREEEKEKFKVIVLSELIFAFAILGIGLGCAGVCFVTEIVVSQPR